jgi:hypothetical protein
MLAARASPRAAPSAAKPLTLLRLRNCEEL